MGKPGQFAPLNGGRLRAPALAACGRKGEGGGGDVAGGVQVAVEGQPPVPMARSRKTAGKFLPLVLWIFLAFAVPLYLPVGMASTGNGEAGISEPHLLWNTTWGGPGSDEGSAIAVGPSGSFYVAGYTTSWGAASTDIVVAKFTSEGEVSWNVTWGSSGAEKDHGIAVDSGGNAYVVGYTNSWVPSPSGYNL